MSIPKRILEKWEHGLSPGPDEKQILVETTHDRDLPIKMRALLRFVRRDMIGADSSDDSSAFGEPDEEVVDGVMESVLGKNARHVSIRGFGSYVTKASFGIGAAAAGIALLISSIALFMHVTGQPNAFMMSEAPSPQPITVAMANTGTKPEVGVTLVVRFELTAPEAKSVSIVGDFNNWDANRYPLSDSNRDGVWEVEIGLTAGRMYTYNFLVDGSKWIVDPNSLRDINDAFGGRKSVLSL